MYRVHRMIGIVVAVAVVAAVAVGVAPTGVVRAQGEGPPDPSGAIGAEVTPPTGADSLAPPVSTMPQALVPQRQCFSPVADAFVYNYFPTTNYGNDPTLQISSIGDVTLDQRTAFLRFDVSTLPSDAVILSAVLQMYALSSAYGGTGYLEVVQGSWTEGGLTWNNQPSRDTAEIDVTSWPASTDPTFAPWQRWTATDLVIKWVRGMLANNGLAVDARGIDTAATAFSSREGNDTWDPQLCVEWATYVDPLDPDAVSWASGRDYNSSDFGAWFAEMSRQGYMLTDIEVDEVDGQERVGGVWQENTDGRDWLETRDMSQATFDSYQETRAAAGYRIIDQEVYQLGGVTYYAAIWMQNVENLGWENYYNVTSTQFATLFTTYFNMGYLPIDVDAYEIGGQLRYAAVWQENIEGLNWYEWQDLTSQEFADYFDQYQANYRMIDVESYQSGGQQYYAGIWVENTNNRGWAEYREMTSKGFHETWAALRDAGYRLIDYELYPTGDGWRYAGVWRQNGDRLNWALKDNVDAAVEAYFASNALPGMSVAIEQNGTFRYLRGLGYKDVDDAVTTDSRTIYRLASVSKAVGGILGVRLSQDGVLDLSAPSAAYIPGLPAFQSHTVSETLTIRSGVGHYPDFPTITGHYDTAYAAVQQLWNNPLVSAPGTQCYYSSHGYTFSAPRWRVRPVQLSGRSSQPRLPFHTTSPRSWRKTGACRIRSDRWSSGLTATATPRRSVQTI